VGWDKAVEEWIHHPVTKAFHVELRNDIEMLIENLIATDRVSDADSKESRQRTSEEYMELRGMIKALRGVLDMGVTDPIYNPNKLKEKGNE